MRSNIKKQWSTAFDPDPDPLQIFASTSRGNEQPRIVPTYLIWQENLRNVILKTSTLSQWTKNQNYQALKLEMQRYWNFTSKFTIACVEI